MLHRLALLLLFSWLTRHAIASIVYSTVFNPPTVGHGFPTFHGGASHIVSLACKNNIAPILAFYSGNPATQSSLTMSGVLCDWTARIRTTPLNLPSNISASFLLYFTSSSSYVHQYSTNSLTPLFTTTASTTIAQACFGAAQSLRYILVLETNVAALGGANYYCLLFYNGTTNAGKFYLQGVDPTSGVDRIAYADSGAGAGRLLLVFTTKIEVYGVNNFINLTKIVTFTYAATVIEYIDAKLSGNLLVFSISNSVYLYNLSSLHYMATLSYPSIIESCSLASPTYMVSKSSTTLYQYDYQIGLHIFNYTLNYSSIPQIIQVMSNGLMGAFSDNRTKDTWNMYVFGVGVYYCTNCVVCPATYYLNGTACWKNLTDANNIAMYVGGVNETAINATIPTQVFVVPPVPASTNTTNTTSNPVVNGTGNSSVGLNVTSNISSPINSTINTSTATNSSINTTAPVNTTVNTTAITITNTTNTTSTIVVTHSLISPFTLPESITLPLSVTLSLPLTRVLSLRFLYLFISDIWLYNYDQRTYEGIINDTFTVVTLLSLLKFEVLEYWLGWGEYGAMLGGSDYRDWTDDRFMQVEGTESVLLVSNFPFFVYTVPETLLLTLALCLLFHLLRPYKLSRHLRSFSFLAPVLVQSLIDGNIAYFTYVCFSHLSYPFCFHFLDRLILVFTVGFFFMLLVAGLSFYFFVGAFLGRNSCHFIYTLYRVNPSFYLLGAKYMLRSFLQGATHFFLHISYSSMLACLSVLDFLTILLILLLQKHSKIFITSITFCRQLLYHSFFLLLNLILYLDYEYWWAEDGGIRGVILLCEEAVVYGYIGLLVLTMVVDLVPLHWLRPKAILYQQYQKYQKEKTKQKTKLHRTKALKSKNPQKNETLGRITVHHYQQKQKEPSHFHKIIMKQKYIEKSIHNSNPFPLTIKVRC